MQAAKKGRFDAKASIHFGQHLKEQGSLNLMERVYEWALGEWPEAQKATDSGKATMTNLMKGPEGLSMLLSTKYPRWTRKQVETLMRDLCEDVNYSKERLSNIM